MKSHEFDLNESNQQAIGAWKRFAQGAPNGESREEAGVICALSKVPMPFLNMVFLSSPALDESDVSARISSAKTIASKAGCPWMFFVCGEWLPQSMRASHGEVFGRHGLQAAMRLTGMAADAVLPPAAPPPALLQYRRVDDRETCFAVSDLNCAAYGFPSEAGRQSIVEGMFGPDVFAYVGYKEGKPVSAAGVWIVDGVAYVAMVATHPDEQRKGYAAAVMRHSLQEAQKATGVTRTVLHATEAGFPVYERMGYRSIAPFTLYAAAHE